MILRYKNYWTDIRLRKYFREYVRESLKNRWLWCYSEALLEAVVADLESIYDDLFAVTGDAIDVSVVSAQI